MNIFRNFVLHNIKEVDYRTPELLNKPITLSFKKRSKLNKRYQNNHSYNQEAVLNQLRECAALTTEAKVRYITKISGKLDNPETALSGQTYI